MGAFGILGISGSIRKASCNAGLLRAAIEVAQNDASIDIYDLSTIPPFNEDLRLAGEPEPVKALKAAIIRSDAVLFAAPEHNYSIPGVLKNAIDWASRPQEGNPCANKPVALMGAGFSSGSMRSQIHLRQVVQCLGMHLLNKPECYVHIKPGLFDANGDLLDPVTKERIKKVVAALVGWTHVIKTGSR